MNMATVPKKEVQYTARGFSRWDKVAKKKVFDAPIKTASVDLLEFEGGGKSLQLNIQTETGWFSATLYPPSPFADPGLSPSERREVEQAAREHAELIKHKKQIA